MELVQAKDKDFGIEVTKLLRTVFNHAKRCESFRCELKKQMAAEPRTQQASTTDNTEAQSELST